MDELRVHIKRQADGVDGRAYAQLNEAADDEYDRMNEIDSASATFDPAPGRAILLETDRRGRRRYYKNSVKNCIVTVKVASRCPEVDPNCTQMRPVKLFITDRKTVWMSINDVAWAVRYLFEHHHLKGVPLVADDDAGPVGGVAGSVPYGAVTKNMYYTPWLWR